MLTVVHSICTRVLAMRLGISRVIHATCVRPIPYETMFQTRFQKLLDHIYAIILQNKFGIIYHLIN